MGRVRGSPIWPPRSPAGRTASTGSGSAAVTVNMSSVLRRRPCHRAEANAAWLEIILAATDLVAWSKLIGFTEQPDLATCEIDTFRYRVLHVAARITRGARQIRLRIAAHSRWAAAISEGWQRLRAAFP